MGELRHILRPGTATSRERGVLHEKPVATEGEAAIWPSGSCIAAIGLHHPGLGNIGQIGRHDLANNLRLDGFIVNFNQCFNPAVQVAIHPIGRGDINSRLGAVQIMAIGKANDAGML